MVGPGQRWRIVHATGYFRQRTRAARPTEGDDPEAIISRIRGALNAGDLKAALAEWSTLPDSIKSPTAEWAKLAEARRAADDLVAEVRRAALSGLEPGQ